MTGTIPETSGPASPWHRYIEREHAARDMYLKTTYDAHREYLTGPWPDRDAYQHVEHTAWITYYAAGREAWRAYTRELATLARQHLYPDNGTPVRDAAGEVRPEDPPRTVTPSQLAQQSANDWAARQGYPPIFPTFTEHERSND